MHAEVEQRSHGPHPHTIEREQGRPHGKRAELRRLAHQAMQPPERPTDRQPFVDVADHDDGLPGGAPVDVVEETGLPATERR